MSGFVNLFKIRLKVRFRELDIVFITIALPLLLTTINASVSGEMNWFLSSGIAMIIILSAFASCTGSVVSDKDRGILRRMYILPTPFSTYIVCEMLITSIFMILSSCMLIGAMTKLGAEIEGSLLTFILTFLLGAFTFLSLAIMVAGFIKTEKMAHVAISILTMALIVPACIPIDIFSPTIRLFIRILPSVALSNILNEAVRGNNILFDNFNNIIILLIWLAIATIVAIRTFEWE
ncbi:MAG: ABC transporter permease [Euryarchaeota archaeon]|nr:ABC transporter permease [Euryarchaeota archaeon]